MPRAALTTEYGLVAQELLQSNRDENVEYDVIVVGSGMGGGVVASALADEKKRVLVLEAGSLLFPTHVGNLPRRLMIGKFQKHIWSIWDRFSVRNYNTPRGGAYAGAQGFNLGGRSIFWGSSIPPLAGWELDAWPANIRQYLLDPGPQGGYAIAREVFNADVPVLEDFHRKSTDILGRVLGPRWEILPAPVAVEYSGPTEWSIPSGIFSTADLLLEDVLAQNIPGIADGREPITVNLNHAVWNITTQGNRATGVQCYDLLENRVRNYKAKAVVLCAGTLESAKIALASGIQNDKIGRGIVDHPILYRHFVVPPQALQQLDLASPTPTGRFEPQSAKILMRHRDATLDNFGFDVILELGAQFNQGRFVDPDHITEDLATKGGYVECEIVFQFYSPLQEQNEVTLGGGGAADHGAPVNVYMERAPIPGALLAQAQAVAKSVLTEFQALPLLGEGDLFTNGVPNLLQADVGGVAHEVGTLRMTTNGQRGVVDEDLRFEGFQNLWACDNSVFPCSPAGNPSLTLVALARRCAKNIAKSV